MEKYGYIYITENLVNNKKYIGLHKSAEFDRKYIGSGVLLRKAINKYGIENFNCKVLQWCYSQEELNNQEKYWISYFNAKDSDKFYNVAEGGLGHTCDPWNKGKHGVQEFTDSMRKNLEIGWHMPASEKLKEFLRNRKNNIEYTYEYRNKLSKRQSRHRTVNDGIRNIIIDVDDLDNYLAKGYIKGRVKKQEGSTTNP